MNDVTIIDRFLDTFSRYIDSGFGLLQGEVAFLTATLIAIDMTIAGLYWAMSHATGQGEDVIAKLLRKVLYVGAFAYIINNFNWLSGIVFRSFAGLGITATGSAITMENFLQPGHLAKTGIDAAAPILDQIGDMAGFPEVFVNLDPIVVLFIAWLVVILCFFVLAVQLFITLIEFKLTTLAGFVLIPFALWNKTSFLAEKVLGNVVSSGIKVLVLAVIVGIGSGLFAEFQVHAQLAQPATCVAGYNSLRFDDEVTRYSLYRNFFDPYAREWQGGNSRWDLIDMVRTAYALRPEGIQWPQLDGRLSLKLEMLTAANGLEHGQAHDALSDVRATIALARLIRQRQPRLYDYLYQLRSKHKVLDQVRLLQPLVHVSGRFSAERHFLSVVLPLAWHPRNRNALIVCDLCADPAPLLELSAEDLRRRLYTRRDELAEGELPVPLKQIQVNRCPVVAPLSVLRGEDRQRTGIELEECQRKAELLRQHQTVWADKLTALYGEESFSASDDPEQQLYDGFIGDRDRRLCEQLRLAEPEQLAKEQWPFDDARLQELFFRYRARNFPETLNVAERQQWESFCRNRLSHEEYGAPNTLPAFEAALEACRQEQGGTLPAVLAAWRDYAAELRQRYSLET
ncbi:exodeoxyribonuclease I [Pseudomonas aeruginosa]|nr:exodeoxyribonuclease I [Pseudomonas aeruginosa]